MLWINGERGRAKVSLPVGPLEYWMYTSDPLRDAPAREAAIERPRRRRVGGDPRAGNRRERERRMSSPRRRWALLIAAGVGSVSVFAFVMLPALLVSTLNACSRGTSLPAGSGS